MTDITAAPEPVQLGRETIVRLPPGLGLDLLDVDDGYWSHAETRSELAEGRILSVFDYDHSWTWWERHPLGDELLFVVEGEVDFHLDDGSTASVVHLGRGQSAIVPTGAWHRAEVRRPSRLLFVTPTPAWTQHRPA